MQDENEYFLRTQLQVLSEYGRIGLVSGGGLVFLQVCEFMQTSILFCWRGRDLSFAVSFSFLHNHAMLPVS